MFMDVINNKPLQLGSNTNLIIYKPEECSLNWYNEGVFINDKLSSSLNCDRKDFKLNIKKNIFN